ncbi:MAG: PEP-CTERM sorting domain-containing protein [Acidobacteria bacterium]|nr:PEP-CTERM sorting domain-containing protein [Acidobacteriota bacterium]
MNMLQKMRQLPLARLFTAGLLLAASHIAAPAANISFGVDPLEGTTVRNSPGRQVVGGELFVSFHTGTETFVFDAAAFGMTEIRFANGAIGDIPTNANVVVLQTRDNDNNALTPFGAGNAADLLAAQITVSGPGLFIYFNSSLDLPRLVYSDDISSNTADLKILARMLNLNGQTGINALPTFTANNFAFAEDSPVPEPSTALLLGAGIALLAFGALKRRRMLVAASFAAALTLAVAAEHEHDASPSPAKLVEIVRNATRQFIDVNAVTSAGYTPLFGCVSGPDHGAMGVHYINLALVGDGEIDAQRPEAIIYEPSAGGMRLVGVEYIVDSATWLKNHSAPPTLEGQAFHLVSSPNRYGLPPFFELHVWAWRKNPNGAFVDWNNRVTCEGQ